MTNAIKSLLLRIRRGSLIQKTYYFVFFLIGKLPTKKDVIVFESFLGKQYSDNPRAIYEYLIDHNSEYRMYWSFDRTVKKSFEEKNLNSLTRLSLKWLWIMPRAKYWVTNSRLPLWIPKSKNTVYIQTWHGTPLKKLATDMKEVHMFKTDINTYKKEFVIEARKWDYLVSPNLYSTVIFKRAFQFTNNIIETGYPRNDYLINNNEESFKKKVKRKLNIPNKKKVILYAPTWRDNQYFSRGKYKLDLKLDLNKLQSELGNDFVILLRMHYLVASKINVDAHKDFAIDCSEYEDIRDLYLISDILVTDYSSVFFDYAILRRPIFFFAYDIEEYRYELRGFYFDIETKAPGIILKSTEKLIEEIRKIEINGYIRKKIEKEFYNKFCYLEDGKSTERVVKVIFQDNK